MRRRQRPNSSARARKSLKNQWLEFDAYVTNRRIRATRELYYRLDPQARDGCYRYLCELLGGPNGGRALHMHRRWAWWQAADEQNMSVTALRRWLYGDPSEGIGSVWVYHDKRRLRREVRRGTPLPGVMVRRQQGRVIPMVPPRLLKRWRADAMQQDTAI